MLISGVPTVFVAYTAPGAKVTVNWELLLSHNVKDRDSAIQISGTIYYTFAVIFSKVRDLFHCLQNLLQLNIVVELKHYFLNT